MKKTTLFIVLVLLATNTYAQHDAALRYRRIATPFNVAVQNVLQEIQMANPADTGEGGEYNAFSRWAEHMGNRVSNDAPVDSEIFLPAAKEAARFMSNPNSYCSSTVPAAWKCLGPFNNYYGNATEFSGRVDYVWCDPNNDSFLIATSLSGGVWQTNNQGHSWHCISDGAPVGPNGVQLPGTVSVQGMAIDPLNRNNIFLYTATPNSGDKSWGYGTGMVFTANGGTNWQADTSFNRLRGGSFSGARYTWALKYMPNTHKLFALSDSQLYVKNGSGSGVWTEITPGGLPRYFKFTEMDFSRRYPGKVIFAGRADSAKHTTTATNRLWVYDTASNTFTSLTLTMPSPLDTLDDIMDVSITNMDTAYLLANGHDTAKFRKLIKSSIYSNSVTVRNNSMGAYFDIVVSPSDQQIIYTRNLGGAQSFFERSTDEGKTFWSIQNNRHIDVRFLGIYRDTAVNGKYEDVVFGGTDGGVVMKRKGDTAFTSITGDSLCISQFYGMSNTEANENYMVGGLQDNGGFSYIKDRATPWENEFNWSDGFLSKIARNNINMAYVGANLPYIERWNFSGLTTSRGSVGNPDDMPVTGSYNYANNIQRPIYFDQNDTAYVGYSQVWRKPLSDYNWHTAFTTPPKSPWAGIKIADIEMYERGNNDTVFIAYRDAGDPYSLANDAVNQKLFRTRDASDRSSGHPVWRSITPAEAKSRRINDITIDPERPWRIWVAFGDFVWGSIGVTPDSMKHNILYSPDFGNTWIDVSTGLGNFPANKILFRKGTNEVYLGTDIGVYTCDFSTFDLNGNFSDVSTGQFTNRSVRWQCFNDGMPTCEITDMEFNYCAGKLRAATFGRGIWETPLPAITNPIDTQQLVISTNTTWNTNKWLESSVFVKSGATLTITSDTIHMPKGGVIAVAPGGKLDATGVVFTNSCDKCFWQGIEARGQVYERQDAAHQGWVRLNGCVVEHALRAVSNAGTDTSYGAHGGIIQAIGTTFRNNQTGAAFFKYDNYYPNGLATGRVLNPNISYFTNCQFLLDNSYKGNTDTNYTFRTMASLLYVEGVTFNGCTFSNTNTWPRNKLKGNGIYAQNSGFMVLPLCLSSGYTTRCTAAQRSAFSGFTSGIAIDGVFPYTPIVSINQADFDYCGIGTTFSAQDNVNITECRYTIGHGLPVHDVVADSFTGCYQNIGILSRNCPQFKIEGNTFNAVSNTAGLSYFNNFGVVVANEPTNNTIFRNSFDSCTVGVYAIGHDRSNATSTFCVGCSGVSAVATGLSVQCNSFSHGQYDIAVHTDSAGIATMDQGIYPDQAQNAPAGNVFSQPAAAFNLMNSAGARSLNYNYTSGVTGANPALIAHATVSTYTVAAACAATYRNIPESGVGGLLPSALATRKTTFNIATKAYNDSLAVFRLRTDWGNRDSLISLLYTSADTVALYNTLVAGSPFISPVLLDTACATHKFSYSQRMDFFNANPDNWGIPGFLDYMAVKYTLTPPDKDLLALMAGTPNRRTLLQRSINANAQKIDAEAFAITNALKAPRNVAISVYDSTGAGICTDVANLYYQLDSNSTYYTLDSVDAFLKRVKHMWAVYERAGLAYYRGNYSGANTIMATIDSYAALYSEPQPEPADYKTMWATLYTASQAGRDVSRLLPGEITQLYGGGTIPFLTSGAGAGTDAIITAGSTPMRLCLSLANDNIPMGGRPSNQAAPTNATGKELKVFPNPAENEVTFAWRTTEPGGIDIIVTNMSGQKVMQRKTTESIGSFVWDTRSLQPGTYLYRATDQRGLITMAKLVIVK